jgi:hypothetical protein
LGALLGGGRRPDRADVAVPELEPAQGIRESNGTRVVAAGVVHRQVECLAAVRGCEGLSAAERGEVGADELDLAPERRLGPALGSTTWITQSTEEPKGVQRQRPSGRRHRRRNVRATGGEEVPR